MDKESMPTKGVLMLQDGQTAFLNMSQAGDEEMEGISLSLFSRQRFKGLYPTLEVRIAVI